MTIKESSLTVTTSEIYLDIDPPKGSYKLDNGGLTPFVAATLLNPRPDGERPAHSRYNFTSSYIPYVVPIHLMGGSPPYNFVFDCDIPGAFLYRKYGNNITWASGLYAEVYIPPGQDGIYSVHVYDQSSDSVPVASVAVTTVLDDSHFIFMDTGAEPGGDGTFAAPFNSCNDWYGPDATYSAYSKKTCVYFSGNYPAPTPGDQAHLPTYSMSDQKPTGHIRVPGHEAYFDHEEKPQGWRTDVDSIGGGSFPGLFLSVGVRNAPAGRLGSDTGFDQVVFHNVIYRDINCTRWGSVDPFNIGGWGIVGPGISDNVSIIGLEARDCTRHADSTEGSAAIIMRYVRNGGDVGCAYHNCTVSRPISLDSDNYRWVSLGMSAWSTNAFASSLLNLSNPHPARFSEGDSSWAYPPAPEWSGRIHFGLFRIYSTVERAADMVGMAPLIGETSQAAIGGSVLLERFSAIALSTPATNPYPIQQDDNTAQTSGGLVVNVDATMATGWVTDTMRYYTRATAEAADSEIMWQGRLHKSDPDAYRIGYQMEWNDD